MSTKIGNATTTSTPTRTNASYKNESKTFTDEYETEREESNKPDIYIEHLNQNLERVIDGKVLKIVNRRKWLAQPAVDEVDDLELPVQYVIICKFNYF